MTSCAEGQMGNRPLVGGMPGLTAWSQVSGIFWATLLSWDSALPFPALWRLVMSKHWALVSRVGFQAPGIHAGQAFISALL